MYWADASHPMGSLYKMRKFRNVSAENNVVTRVAGHLALLTDVCVHHELRQPPGVLMMLFSRIPNFNDYLKHKFGAGF